MIWPKWEGLEASRFASLSARHQHASIRPMPIFNLYNTQPLPLVAPAISNHTSANGFADLSLTAFAPSESPAIFWLRTACQKTAISLHAIATTTAITPIKIGEPRSRLFAQSLCLCAHKPSRAEVSRWRTTAAQKRGELLLVRL